MATGETKANNIVEITKNKQLKCFFVLIMYYLKLIKNVKNDIKYKEINN